MLRGRIRAELGLDTTVLFWLARSQEPASQAHQILTVLECHEVLSSGSGEWRAAESWPALSAPGKSLDEAFRAWLSSSVEGQTPTQRAPWALPGWLAETTSRIDARLQEIGIARSGPVEQHRTWSISCLLRVPATAGEFYYKAVPPLFAREPRLTAALAVAYPGEIPDVVGVDEERPGMLMRAFAGRHLEECDELALWQGALRRYAQIQQESAPDYERWLRLGCSDRRLAVLSTQLDSLLADRAALETGGRLTAGEIEELHRLVPWLQAACHELEAIGLPYTLEHGDLHANNILITGGHYLFFDWTDGCITHPFFCLLPFLEWVRKDWHDGLIGAYLEQWQGYLPSAELRRALSLARPLGAMHMAISYWDIHNATEPALRWELEGGIPSFLSQVLRFYKELEDSGGATSPLAASARPMA
jgi:hypothetical protein